MKKQEEKETEIQLLRQENGELKEEIAELKQQLTVIKKLVFGQKSEKTEYIADGQISLFNEAECEENRKARAEEKPVVVAEHTRKAKRTHDELAKDLPVLRSMMAFMVLMLTEKRAAISFAVKRLCGMPLISCTISLAMSGSGRDAFW